MSIVIKDETANATVLTIDNNGNMAFADGTPINSLTLNGYGIIDSEGYIVHGLGSNSVQPAYGYVAVPNVRNYGGVTVATLVGVIPTAVADVDYPAYNHVLVGDPGNPDAPETQVTTTVLLPTFSVQPDVGSFTVISNSVALDGRLLDYNSQYYDPSLSDTTMIGYRWI